MSKDFLGVEYAPFCSLLSAKFPTLDQALLHALEALQKEIPVEPIAGICWNMRFSADEYFHKLTTGYQDCPYGYIEGLERLYEIFKLWPHYTGEQKFPVPHPTKDPMSAFMEADDCWVGEYGKKRKSLLSFCIHFLKENQQ